jgi:hypothetical protein
VVYGFIFCILIHFKLSLFVKKNDHISEEYKTSFPAKHEQGHGKGNIAAARGIPSGMRMLDVKRMQSTDDSQGRRKNSCRCHAFKTVSKGTQFLGTSPLFRTGEKPLKLND